MGLNRCEGFIQIRRRHLNISEVTVMTLQPESVGSCSPHCIYSRGAKVCVHVFVCLSACGKGWSGCCQWILYWNVPPKVRHPASGNVGGTVRESWNRKVNSSLSAPTVEKSLPGAWLTVYPWNGEGSHIWNWRLNTARVHLRLTDHSFLTK